MMDVDVHVRGCNECPLRYDGIRCHHPSENDVDDTDGSEPHELCPLRTGVLTIRLAPKAEGT